MLQLLQPVLWWVRSRWEASRDIEQGMTTETIVQVS